MIRCSVMMQVRRGCWLSWLNILSNFILPWHICHRDGSQQWLGHAAKQTAASFLYSLYTQGFGLFQHLLCLLSWKTYDTSRWGKWARADGLSRKWHTNTWESGCGSPYLFLLLLIPTERLINHPLPQLSAEPAENAKINMKTSPWHPPQEPRHQHMWRQATFSRFPSRCAEPPSLSQGLQTSSLPIFNQCSAERSRRMHLPASVGHHRDEYWQMYTDNPSAAQGQI